MEGRAGLNEEDSRHALRVLRLREGDEVELVCAPERFLAVIDGVEAERVRVRVLHPLRGTEAATRVTLYQGLPKADKMELIIQKATELGAAAVQPVAMERCVVRLDGKDAAKKTERWQKIAREAVKQCARVCAPEVRLPQKLSTLRQELGIPEDRFVMLCASRFAEDKGHKYLIDSVKRLTQITDVPFTLVLAGDGPLLEETKAHAEALGLTEEQVRFIGFRNDIKNLYKASDLYVNSSQHEALSYLIIEAMAAGLPVIATDMGGNSDIVNDEAGCGLLVTYDDPVSMSDAMKRMLEEPEFLAQCRQGALRTIDEKFEIHKWMDKTFSVYEAAMAR